MSDTPDPSSGRKRPHLALPVEPTDDELARDWTLSEADHIEVLRCRGDDSRLRFAIQLCALRAHGRFVNNFITVPVRIANYLGRQLSLPPVLFVEPPGREATDLAHERRVRALLGMRSFDASTTKKLERWLAERAGPDTTAPQLVERAEDILRSWKVVLPARSTLERVARSIASRTHKEIFQGFEDRLSPELGRLLDEFLEVPSGERRSPLFWLKQYPPEATPISIASYIDRFETLNSRGVEGTDVEAFSPHLVEHLAQLGEKYEVDALKRFAAPKRHAIVACFLVEAHKTILDHVVAMNHQFLTGMNRRSRHALERRQIHARRRAKKGLEVVLQAIEILVDPDHDAEAALVRVLQETERRELREALENCRELQRVEELGYLDELRARHHQLKRYFPGFLMLPFEAEPGAEGLLAAVELARRLEQRKTKTLPKDAPTSFIPRAWLKAAKTGRIDRPLWDLGLAFALRDALRSGNIYIPASRQHISFWNLVYDQRRWTVERSDAYVELGLPPECERAVSRLREEFNEAAARLERGIDDNSFASIQDGKLKLKRRDALDIPDAVRDLRRLVETQLAPVRIEELLLNVDSWCQFSRELRPLGDYRRPSGDIGPALFAAIVAHGTNLGVATMAQSTEGITMDMLQHVSRWFLREETLKAANRVLVDYHHRLALSSVWGDGATSSSDGQRFRVDASSLLASFYPRYFGYYERAITVYTHVSDQYSVFASRAISCSPREAIYVLDGLLENDTILRPREHFTDTHGFTEQLFGLCYLLGYSFMPRLKDLKDQQLYKLERRVNHGALQPLFRSAIDTDLVRGQWDQLVRVAASLRNRTAPAHVVLERLAASSPSDTLAKSLTTLGRIVKTIYIFRYLHDETLRDRVQLQLNRGESRHQLARRLFFANQGAFRTGDYQEIMNKVSALSLLSNAVLVFNTVRLAEILERLKRTGENVDEEALSRISPLLHAHVIPNGTYHFDRPSEPPQVIPQQELRA